MPHNVKEESATNQRARTAVPPGAKYAIRLIVAVALLTYVFSRVSFTSVITAMEGVDRTLILLAFVAAIAVQFFSSARLKLVLASQGIRLSLWAVFEINLATRFYNLFLPGGSLTGMAIRVLKVSRLQRDVAAAGAAVLVDRLVATLMLCVLGVVFWLLQRPPPELVWLGLFVGCAVILVLVVSLLAQPASLNWLRGRIPGWLPARQEDSVQNAIRHAGRLRGSEMAGALALSVAVHLIGVLCYWLVLASMALGLSVVASAWVRSVMLLVTLLPISVAGLGVREIGAYLVLRFYGMDAPTAVTFSLLITLVSVIGTGFLGGLLESLRFTSRGRV